jgi:hypothetical protein
VLFKFINFDIDSFLNSLRMKKILSHIRIIALFMLVLTTAGRTYASHIAGAEVTYQHISGNTYQVNLNLFVDCLGFDPGATQTINLASSCGQTAMMTVSVTNPGGTEISQICPSQIGNTTCSGGSLPGMWIFNFTGTTTLPSTCNNWSISWTTCCRNAATTNLTTPSSFGIYVEALVFRAVDSTNNSAYFTAETKPYVFAGQPVNYNYGVLDADGDSLYFTLISAEDSGGTPLAYSPGYSATSPIPGITIDPNTGMLSFTPSTVGTFVVAVLVEEFDSWGNIVGSVMRDIQFQVLSCTNNTPSASSGAIINFTGNAVLTGSNSIEMCAGNNFAFDAVFTDADVSDTLTYTSNITALLPGATITSSGVNPLTLHVSWTGPLSTAAGTKALTIDIRDKACPVIGLQSFLYNIRITAGTYAGPDVVICASPNTVLNATGGGSFLWTVISGPPMIVGTNFSCDTCATAVASPASTTVYQVESDLSTSCHNMDTVVVNVVPPFTYNASAALSTICIGQADQLSVTGLSPAGPGYSYQWLPSAYLDNNMIGNPVATIGSAGSHTYIVTVTNSSGCSIQDTVMINILSSMAPRPLILASDTAVCSGTIIQLTTSFEGVPAVCGITPIGCTASTASVVGSGSGANATTAFPAPYGNWYSSVKQQYLYTAAELNAAGITGGKIDQIDFNITTVSGITSYLNYSISMGCTGLSTFASGATTFETGLYNVFPAQTFPIAAGWNAHPFTNAFEWDGVSNVIVEVCMNQLTPASSYTSNSVSPNDGTSNVSCLFSLSDSDDQCSAATAFVQTAMIHPQIRFHSCSGVADTSSYIYSWMPSGAVMSPSAQVTNALITSAGTYTVTVTDTSNGCASSASQAILLDGVNMAIDGYVNYTGLPVDGYAKLFSYVSGVQMPMADSVAITGGNYIFLNVMPGDYIVQATADSILFPLAFPTYYDTVVNWDSADIITMYNCNDTTTANITMLSGPSLVGTNVLSGTIIEGTGYLHSAGMPLPGINVILLDNASGAPLAHALSDNGGIYRFDNIPSGCYRIYVDIPGLPMTSTYTPCVTGNDTLTNLYFIADASSIFTTNSALSVEEVKTNAIDMKIYPNPTAGNSVIEFHLEENSFVDLEVMNSLGQKVVKLLNEQKMGGTYKLDFNAASLGCAPGTYLIKIQVNETVQVQKMSLSK